MMIYSGIESRLKAEIAEIRQSVEVIRKMLAVKQRFEPEALPCNLVETESEEADYELEGEFSEFGFVDKLKS